MALARELINEIKETSFEKTSLSQVKNSIQSFVFTISEDETSEHTGAPINLAQISQLETPRKKNGISRQLIKRKNPKRTRPQKQFNIQIYIYDSSRKKKTRREI